MTQLTNLTQTPSLVKTSPYPASLQALHLAEGNQLATYKNGQGFQ